jgi:ATP-dependent Zn protease
MGSIASVVKSAAQQADNFSQFYRACIRNYLEKLSGKIKAKDEVCEDTLHCTAYHEAGHAVAMGLLSNNGFADILVADIHPRDSSLGLVLRATNHNKNYSTKRKIKHEIQIAMAGRAAELLLANCEEDLSIGAQSDITIATRLAKKAITRLGFSNQQNLFDHSEFNLSDHDVREEVKEWMQQAHQSVTTLLKDNWHLVTALADALKKENLLFTEDIQQVIVSAGFKTGCERKNKHAIH